MVAYGCIPEPASAPRERGRSNQLRTARLKQLSIEEIFVLYRNDISSGDGTGQHGPAWASMGQREPAWAGKDVQRYARISRLSASLHIFAYIVRIFAYLCISCIVSLHIFAYRGAYRCASWCASWRASLRIFAHRWRNFGTKPTGTSRDLVPNRRGRLGTATTYRKHPCNIAAQNMGGPADMREDERRGV